ncbi:hypothetical protein CROQUDRAFT_41933 [Cronartium quercuum f. sp. fusiforme G11]|uniref:Large ribosomal subunit protein mL49 n=1 Tax=Cronartium quercuum f. sp. fusiforme G11 TaxID=708437 RepID=A0A9P6TDU7_9BASI|nr:hypothetical protein CROQUDRAFT_41933 [Cronartium quercuum f. sp. fusiforme G11]
MSSSISRLLSRRPTLSTSHHFAPAQTLSTERINPSRLSPIQPSRPQLPPLTHSKTGTPIINVIPDRLWKAPLGTAEKPLGYHVQRTVPFGTLPVYTKMRPALSQVWTLVKKIEGDIEKLKSDLILDFPESRPIVKPRIKQVHMRGKITREVKLWLQDRGF